MTAYASYTASSWRPRTLASVTPPPAMTQTTGPLNPLQGRRVLVLADVENLSYSAQKNGFMICYATLGSLLSQPARRCARHAFLSLSPHAGDQTKVYFQGCGWTLHSRAIEVVRTFTGEKKRANIDSLLLFQASLLAVQSGADTVVLASGDGDLVCDLAQALRTLPTVQQVLSLSLAGSTSWRINAQQNPHLAANIELGRDCLHAF